ncbi:MAG: hypothetical protein IT546_04250 [Caulobacteraceae bacterium]|nr:hypothetical protein [Caulobacteraceae bacterium]
MSDEGPGPRRATPALLWALLGLAAVAIFVVVLWSLRPPSPGIGDAPTQAVPVEPPMKPLPDAEPLTRGSS